MIETIILAMIFAKIKGYEIKPFLKSWAFYPIVIIELLNLVGQVLIFTGNYDVVKIMTLSKSIYLCSYLFLIFKYELFKHALVGSGFIFLGGALNDLAIKANNGHMPVFPTISYLTGYVKPEAFELVNDIHVLGNSENNLKILTDFIDLGYSILSIGDVLIRVFVFLIIYNSIKRISKTKEKIC